MATGDQVCPVCKKWLTIHANGEACLSPYETHMDPMSQDAYVERKKREMNETEAKLNYELRQNLCKLLGLSEAVSNWEIEEAVEVIYKPVKDIAERERVLIDAENKLKELRELQKNNVRLDFNPGFFALLTEHLKWTCDFVGQRGFMGQRLYTEVMRQTGVNIIWTDEKKPDEKVPEKITAYAKFLKLVGRG